MPNLGKGEAQWVKFNRYKKKSYGSMTNASAIFATILLAGPAKEYWKEAG
jgi:hypothetical protein